MPRAGAADSDENIYRITRVLTLVKQVLERSKGSTKVDKDENAQRVLGALVRLLAIVGSLSHKSGSQNLREILAPALTGASRLVSPSTVLYTCLQLLRSNDAALQMELYILLSNRLGEVAPEARSKMTDDMILMVRVIKETLATSTNPRLSIATLDALRVITKSARISELSALSQVVSTVVSALDEPAVSISGLEALDVLW